MSVDLVSHWRINTLGLVVQSRPTGKSERIGGNTSSVSSSRRGIGGCGNRLTHTLMTSIKNGCKEKGTFLCFEDAYQYEWETFD